MPQTSWLLGFVGFNGFFLLFPNVQLRSLPSARASHGSCWSARNPPLSILHPGKVLTKSSGFEWMSICMHGKVADLKSCFYLAMKPWPWYLSDYPLIKWGCSDFRGMSCLGDVLGLLDGKQPGTVTDIFANVSASYSSPCLWLRVDGPSIHCVFTLLLAYLYSTHVECMASCTWSKPPTTELHP